MKARGGRRKGRPAPDEARAARRRLGAYFTPPWLAREVVEKTLYPHLLWMAQDPEGWDRAHRRPPVREPGPRTARMDLDAPAARAREAELNRDDPNVPNGGLLRIALSAAVPLHIAELRRLTPDQRIRLAHSLADTVSSKGDVLMYGSKRKGEAAEVFNAVAKGLAACAYQPGGVTLFGMHWEAAP